MDQQVAELDQKKTLTGAGPASRDAGVIVDSLANIKKYFYLDPTEMSK